METSNIKELTPTTIFIQDLAQTSNLMVSEVEKNLSAVIIKILNDNYLDREREIMAKFAFDFCVDLYRKNGVAENQISEKLSDAENFFDQKFGKK